MSAPEATADQRRDAMAPRCNTVSQSDGPCASFIACRVYDRLSALEHQTIEVADLAVRIVAVGLVQQAAIVPDHHVAGMPFVAVLEFELGRMLQQLVEQREGFRLAHPDDFLDPDWIDVDRLAAIVGMNADQRMGHRLGRDLLSLARQLRKLTLAVFALVHVTRLAGHRFSSWSRRAARRRLRTYSRTACRRRCSAISQRGERSPSAAARSFE